MRSTARSLFADLTDRDLLATVKQLAACERSVTVDLIASLAEIDTRRLYLGAGCASLFAYCTRVLRLSEHAAYHRIEAARAAARFPIVFERLADGSLTLTNITLLARHLTPENATAVLDAACGRSKREVERQVAALAPRPDVPSSVRRLPVRTPATVAREPAPIGPATPVRPVNTAQEPRSQDSLALFCPAGSGVPHSRSAASGSAPADRRPARRPVVAPLSADRYKVQITVSPETVDRLRRLQDLMRHTVPDGDPAIIVERAITVLLEQVERTRFSATGRPRMTRRPSRTRSRHIPAPVRREVWARDGEQCTFVGPEGRCNERGFLQFHHLDPYALGGDATVDRIALRCRAHNLYDAELVFGRLPGEVREART